MDKKPSYIDTLLIYTLWYEFSNDFETQSNFRKGFVTKISTQLDHSYPKNALVSNFFCSFENFVA